MCCSIRALRAGILDPACHPGQHGLGLLFRGVRIAQPFHQAFFCGRHWPLLFDRPEPNAESPPAVPRKRAGALIDVLLIGEASASRQ
jgi:hypothetical protein